MPGAMPVSSNLPALTKLEARGGSSLWGYLEPVDAIKHKLCRIDLLTGDQVVTLGRAPPSCDIVLPSKYISENHCKLRWDGRREPGSAYIADMGSKNHTWVGRKKLTASNGYYQLLEGDVISFRHPEVPKKDGDVTFAFVFHYNSTWLEKSGQWQVVRELGRGAFSQVFLGWNTRTSTFIAMKQLSLNGIRKRLRRRFPASELEEATQQRLVYMMLREVMCHFAIRHPHIVDVIGLLKEGPNRYVLLEFCSGGTVAGWMERRRYSQVTDSWDPRVAQALAYEVCTAVRACHASGIIHSDLKPENVLLRAARPEHTAHEREHFDREHWPSAVIADFGLAFRVDDPDVTLRPQCGTPAYMAPEVAGGEHPTAAADVYSVGIMVCEMLTGWRPKYKHLCAQEHAPGECQSNLPRLSARYGVSPDPVFIDWLTGMLAMNPTARPTMDAAVNHQWLEEERVARPELLNIAVTPDEELTEHMKLVTDV